MKIHNRLTIWNIVTLFFAILIVSSVVLVVILPQIQEQSLEVVDLTVEDISVQLAGDIREAGSLAKNLALSPGFLKTDAAQIPDQSIFARLNLSLVHNPLIFSAYITHDNGTHGKVAISFRAEEGSNTLVSDLVFAPEMLQDPVYQFLKSFAETVDMGEFIVTPAYFDATFVNKPMISILSPLYVDGEYYGLTGVDVVMDQLFDKVAQVNELLDNDTIGLLLDGDNTILSHTKDDAGEWDFANNWDRTPTTFKFKDWADASGIEGIEQATTAIGSEEHATLTLQDRLVAIEHVEFTEWTLVAISPATVIEQVATSFLGTTILVSIIALVASGGFTYWYNRYRVGSQINSVTKVAKTMAERDLTAAIEINTSIDELVDLRDSFISMREALRETIGNMSSTSLVLQSSSEELQSGTEEINASAEEVASTSQAMSNGATTQTELINEVSEEIKQTTKLVDEIIASIRNNTNQVSQIALQTNILALNAGIEASRAGDYGRGFAVVAENIRKLSDQSKVASESITEVADEIAARLEEAFNKISSTMLNVVSVSEETAASAEEVAAAAEEMTATIEEIASAASELTTQAEFSAEQVTQFRLEKKAE